LKEILSHLKNHVPSLKANLHTLGSGTFRIRHTISSDYGVIHLVCHSHHFLVIIWKTTDHTLTTPNCYMIFVLIVADLEADKKFVCGFELSGNGRRLVCQTLVRSIRVSVADLTHECLCLDEITAQLYTINRKLVFIASIKSLWQTKIFSWSFIFGN
jgi:Seven in absentia protein family